MPRSTAATALVALAICVAAAGVSAQHHELHGSGTTNPSKFFWKVMDLMEERSRTPVTMTYRAVGTSRARAREPVVCETRRVTFPPEKRKDPAAFTRRLNRDLLLRSRRPLVSGSGTGQSDFIGDGTANGNYNHFGSGDIPFDSDDFAAANVVHSQFIQVPFVIGGIAFFHSVPASFGEIDLDACLLAKIFNRDITVWNHADIVALNPALASLDQPITVARRVEGSSSTSLITKYLNAECPTVWTTAMVGKVPCDDETTTSCVNWKTDTVEAQGSGGISGYLAANDYSISYIDIGHGLASGLGEIALKNADEFFVKPSTEGAVAGAALGSTGATGATREASDYINTWEDVSLMNQAGADTWPICTFSYLYIKKDMRLWSGEEAKTAALVKAFAEFVLSEEAQDMLPEFGFVGLPAEILAKARTAVSGIQVPANTEWTFEKDTNYKLNMVTGVTDETAEIIGQDPLVFSSKRSAYADYERTKLVAAVAALEAQVATLQAEHVTLHPSAWYDDPTTQIEGAAAVGALGFIFGFIGLVLGAVAMSRVKGLAKNAGGGYQI
jgi:ABC-type phosphate transport system substrate-binding protein